MSSYTTIQQHQPLRVPTGWSQEEKRLIAQLEEIFDDIYRRYGRLRLSDLGKDLQIEITEGEIKVGRINVTELLSQSAAIDVIKTMTVSSVEAGSTVTINKDEVSIATPEFSVDIKTDDEDAGSYLRINRDGVFTQNLAVDGEIANDYIAKRYGDAAVTYTITSFSDVAARLRGRYLDRDIIINCNSATKIWPDVVTLTGIYGPGSITINGNGVQLSGLFTVESCSVKITVNKLYANYVQDRSPYLTLNDCATSSTVTVTDKVTYKASNASTYRTAGTTFYGYGDYFYQGATGSYKNLYGYLWCSGAAALSGRTVRKASLKLRRAAGIGGGTAAKITLYTSTRTGPTGDGASGLTKVGDIGSIYAGEEKTFDLPVAAAQSLISGGAIVFYTEETAPSTAGNTSGRYAKFYGVGDYTPEITITYDSTATSSGNSHVVTDGGFGQYLIKAGLPIGDGISGVIPIAYGGTGADNATDARANLGAVNKAGDTMTGTLYHQGTSYPVAFAIGTSAKPECVSILLNGDGTSTSSFGFRQYGTNGNRENFNLPSTSAPAANTNYYIYTSKNPPGVVTVGSAQYTLRTGTSGAAGYITFVTE